MNLIPLSGKHFLRRSLYSAVFCVLTIAVALFSSCTKEKFGPEPGAEPATVSIEISEITRYPSDEKPVGCCVSVYYRVHFDNPPDVGDWIRLGCCTLTGNTGDPIYCDTVNLHDMSFVSEGNSGDITIELDIPFVPPGTSMRIRPFIFDGDEIIYGKTVDWSMPAIITDDNCMDLPVIFHLLCENPASVPRNFSREVLDRIMAAANLGFRNAMPGRVEWCNGEDTHIRLVRAETDPSGRRLAVPGLDIVQWSALPINYAKFIDKPTSEELALCWDPYRYLNVWIFPFSEDSPTLAAGVSTLPTMLLEHPLEGLESNDYYAGSQTDKNRGVALNAGYIYSLMESPVLVHEAGHYLGLYHAFSANGCGTDDDYCADTRDYDYSAFVEEYNYFTDPRIDCADGTEFFSFNIMDYNGFQTLFTPNQNSRMQHALQYGYFIPGSEASRSKGSTKSRSDAKPPKLRIMVTPPASAQKQIRFGTALK